MTIAIWKYHFLFAIVVFLVWIDHAESAQERTGYSARILAWNEPVAGVLNDTLSLGRFHFRFSPDGRIASITDGVDGLPMLDAMSFQIEDRGKSKNFILSGNLGGLQIDEPFFYRRKDMHRWVDENGMDQCTSESYTEVVHPTQCISYFNRVTGIPSDKIVDVVAEFRINRRLSNMSVYGVTSVALENSTPNSISVTAKNHFFVVFDPSSSTGLILAMYPREVTVRKWDTTYYTIVDTLESFGMLSNEGRNRLRFTVPGIRLEKDQTVDINLYIIPFTGTIASAVAGLKEIYTGRRGLGYYFSQYYYPFEGYSNSFLKPADGFVNLPAGSFTWGWLTQEFTMVEGLMDEYRNKKHRLIEDELIRHYANYISKTGPEGLVRYKIFPDHWLKRDHKQLYAGFVFARSAMSILKFGIEYFGRKGFTYGAEEFERWNRIKVLYDPDDVSSWTVRESDTSCWFLYTNFWKDIRRLDHLPNAHGTALVLAMEMEAFAEQIGHRNGAATWSAIVDNGINGLVNYLHRPGAWENGIIGGTLVYEEGKGKVRNYGTVLRETIRYGYAILHRGYRKNEIFDLLKIAM